MTWNCDRSGIVVSAVQGSTASVPICRRGITQLGVLSYCTDGGHDGSALSHVSMVLVRLHGIATHMHVTPTRLTCVSKKSGV